MTKLAKYANLIASVGDVTHLRDGFLVYPRSPRTGLSGTAKEILASNYAYLFKFKFKELV